MRGEKYVWMALAFLGWLLIMYYLLTTLDPNTICSANQPC